MTPWTVADIPDQTGRTVLITGANSGLGLRSAHALAAKGARVLLGCRDAERGREALISVAGTARVKPELVPLDLASLDSVRQAADQVRSTTEDRLDVLMNNAGVMAVPRAETADGFELQIGTNHLGHAALTWLLMPALRTVGSRVVTLSSIAHHGNQLDVDDLHFARRPYSPGAAYSQSKIANLLFSFELDRRARRAGLDLVSVAAHPGMTNTELATNMVRAHRLPGIAHTATRLFMPLISQDISRGVLPQLHAATAPNVRGGEYYGPDGFREMRGYPTLAKVNRAAQDEPTAAHLWSVTAHTVGITPDPA